MLLVSLLHQPLTLLLVYGDKRQFDLRRALFTWVPPVAIAALIVAVSLHWWFIIPIAGLWQIYHTEQQRYGMLRIYGRKAGYGSARLDRAVLYVPFLLALGAVALLPSTRDQLRRFGAKLGGPNVENINTLLNAAGDHRRGHDPGRARRRWSCIGAVRAPGARGRAPPGRPTRRSGITSSGRAR